MWGWRIVAPLRHDLSVAIFLPSRKSSNFVATAVVGIFRNCGFDAALAVDFSPFRLGNLSGCDDAADDAARDEGDFRMSVSEAFPTGAYGGQFGQSRKYLDLTRKSLEREWKTIWLSTLMRALCVACSLGGVFVLAAKGERPDVAKPPAALRIARVPSPVVALAQGDDFPLDADFSTEQAAQSWARRVNPNDRDPSVIRFGVQRVQRSIVERVVKAAKNTGSDPALLMSIADKESSFSSTAKANTSSASGLFQFVETTWLKAVRSFGWRYGHEEEARAIGGEDEHPLVDPQKRARILNLRNDPYLSAAMAAEMLKQDGAKIAERIGRGLTAGETYLIHFLGPEDATRFMTKLEETPDASAAQLLPKPAKANKPIFFERQGGKMKDRSIREVHEAFEHMMGARTSRFQDVEARLPPEAQAYAATDR